MKSLRSILNYKVSLALSYLWKFGPILLSLVIVQLLTGIILSVWYLPQTENAFISVNEIMREVKFGWLVRYFHTNGASLIFFSLYAHMLRSIYYRTYYVPRHLSWISGMILLLLMIGISFFGYTLPWASMSYWAATVITSLISVVPYFGIDLVELVWGGFGLGQPMLSRMFTLHFITPFILLVFIIIHLYELHKIRSSDPLGDFMKIDTSSFNSVYILKDLVGYILLFSISGVFVFYYPNFLSHPLNYIFADPFVTPPHIVPEWYFFTILWFVKISTE